MKLFISILLICIFLSGCTTWTRIYRDAEGRIEKVESSGSVKTIIKENEFRVEQDSKAEPLIKLPDVKFGNIQ